MLISQVKKIIPHSIKRSLRAIADPKKLYLQATASVHPTPIFILGHEKSGTTVIAELLSKISGKTATIDLFPKIDRQGKLQDRLFNQELAWSDFIQSHKFYFSTPINKAPKFTFFYQDLRQYFPKAKFIFVIRDPRDTIRSFLNRRQIPGDLNQIDSLQGKTAYLGSLRPPIAGDFYIERFAHRWNLAADTYINHAEDMFLIHYEDFLLDKMKNITSLAHKVELDVIHDISKDLDKQYQPRGDRNITWLKFFGRDNLQRIETICRKPMKYFDYNLSL